MTCIQWHSRQLMGFKWISILTLLRGETWNLKTWSEIQSNNSDARQAGSKTNTCRTSHLVPELEEQQKITGIVRRVENRQADRGRTWHLLHLHLLLSPHTKDRKQTLAWEVWSQGERLGVQMAHSGRAANKTVRGLRERTQCMQHAQWRA